MLLLLSHSNNNMITFFSVSPLFDSLVIGERVPTTQFYPRFAAAQFHFLHCNFNFCESDLFCCLSDSDKIVSITVESKRVTPQPNSKCNNDSEKAPLRVLQDMEAQRRREITLFERF